MEPSIKWIVTANWTGSEEVNTMEISIHIHEDDWGHA
jgi:hypothetical protein